MTTAPRTYEYTLPDRRVISCTNPLTASLICEEFGDGSYDACVSRLRPGETVIDVGAHVGLISLMLSKAVDNLRIIACEPAPPTFACLDRNFARHLPRGTALHAAVGARPGTTTLTYYPNSDVMSTIFVDAADDQRTLEAGLTRAGVESRAERDGFISHCRSGAQKYLVRMVTISELLDKQGILEVGLLKIDVERAELDVLRGIDERHWPAIRAVAAEVHNIDGRLNEFVDLLKEKGFTLHDEEKLYDDTSLHLVTASR